MRILVVTHYTLPHKGGIEVLSFNQAKALFEYGHDVSIISSRIGHEAFQDTSNGIKFIRFSAWNYLEKKLGIPYPVFSPLFIAGLIKALKKADICIIHSIGFMSSFFAALFSKRLNVPYVLIQHNQFINYKAKILNVIESINDRLFGKYVAINAAEILSVSLKTREYIKKISGREASILNNFAAPSFHFHPLSKEKIRMKLNLPTKKFIIFTCGRLVYNKSIETLLEVAFLLRKQPQFFFLIIGEGVKKNALEKYIQQYKLENSLIIEGIEHKHIRDYYYASDIFILPSQEGEGSPITLLEAMASSLPIITTQSANQNDLFLHKKNCLLVKANAPKQIANLLSEYLKRPAELSRISQEAKNLTNKYYSPKKQIKLLESILIRTLKTKSIISI